MTPYTRSNHLRGPGVPGDPSPPVASQRRISTAHQKRKREASIDDSIRLESPPMDIARSQEDLDVLEEMDGMIARHNRSLDAKRARIEARTAPPPTSTHSAPTSRSSGRTKHAPSARPPPSSSQPRRSPRKPIIDKGAEASKSARGPF
jgi:hypothetical protein